MYSRCGCALAGLVALGMFAGEGAIGAEVDFRLIARSGDAFPGRPGVTYDAVTPFLGAKSNDPNGDIYFYAQGKSGSGEAFWDMLVYRTGTGVVEPYVQSGESIGGK